MALVIPRGRALAGLVLCSCLAVGDSFVGSPLLSLQQQPRAALSSHALRDTTARVVGRPATLQMGAIEYVGSRLPANPDKEACACGSGLTYRNCCSEWHERGEKPVDPIVLIKTRYSAFAYNLPEFIIATTSKEGPEFNSNTESWDAQLRDFSKTYSFRKLSGETLGVSVEECKFWDGQRASVLFKARMLGEDNKLIELWERAVLIREREDDGWMYLQGKLLEHSGPLL